MLGATLTTCLERTAVHVCADLNSVPEVLRSISVKNFKKNADVLVDLGDVLKRPNIFHISFPGE